MTEQYHAKIDLRGNIGENQLADATYAHTPNFSGKIRHFYLQGSFSFLHSDLVGSLMHCIIGGLIVKCCHLSRWQVLS